MARKKTSAQPSAPTDAEKEARAAKRKKPKENNPARNAAELRAYAKAFLDWAVACSGTMTEGAYRLEEFDPEHEVVLITSMIDKFQAQISRRVENQFGKRGKLADDIDKERARRELSKIMSRRRSER